MMDFIDKYKQLIIGLLIGLIIGLSISFLLPQNTKNEELDSLLNINEVFTYSKDNINISATKEEIKITDSDSTVNNFNLRGSISYYLDLNNLTYVKDKDNLTVTIKDIEAGNILLDYNTSTVIDENDGLITLKEARIRLTDYHKIEDYFSNNINLDDIYSEAKEELHKQAIVYINNRLTDLDLNVSVNFE
ncbi:MAG: DUF4230 domain-containing protein [Erysipelotrichaceae bacterium]